MGRFEGLPEVEFQRNCRCLPKMAELDQLRRVEEVVRDAPPCNNSRLLEPYQLVDEPVEAGGEDARDHLHDAILGRNRPKPVRRCDDIRLGD